MRKVERQLEHLLAELKRDQCKTCSVHRSPCFNFTSLKMELVQAYTVAPNKTFNLMVEKKLVCRNYQ